MTVPSGSTQSACDALPVLRRDLAISVAAERDGAFPDAIITDPAKGSYFRISWPRSALLLLWAEAQSKTELMARVRHDYGWEPGEDDVSDLIAFAQKNELTESDEKGGWQAYATAAAAGRKGLGKKLLHNYLFFRVPLVHPDRQLRAMLPYFAFAFSRWFWLVIGTVAALGLYLSTRQWDALLSAIHSSLSIHRLPLFGVALLALKAVHELGHALTTVRYGCRVPSMGVAVMLGAPVLYTDTSDSWRLTDPRARLRIVMAGVAAESIIASFALLLWPMLPEGPARQICFGLAGMAIVMSLAVNLNPFMRFDGYFALSDALRLPNLQARAFALATWRMREALFGLDEPPPEIFAPAMQRLVLVYAFATWIYRFFLYLGIAALVYVMAGKALGIVLGFVELMVFIALPVWREVQQWWRLRQRIAVSRRAVVTAGFCGIALLVLTVPWVGTVASPAVLVAGAEQELHLPVAARVEHVRVRNGDVVDAGAVLVEAMSPEIDHKLAAARRTARLVELRLRRMPASAAEQEQRVVLDSELKRARQLIDGLTRQRAALNVTAPFAGRIVDLDPEVAPGVWLSAEHMIGRIASTQAAHIKGLVPEVALHRLTTGAAGLFVPDEPALASRAVTLIHLAPASDGVLAEPALAQVHGGPVRAAEEAKGLVAQEGWVEAVYQTRDLPPDRLVRGIVRLDVEPQSPLRLMLMSIGRVMVREQAF